MRLLLPGAVLAALLSPVLATAQEARPENNLVVAVNGMFRVCPPLVGGRAVPDTAALAALGLTAAPADTAGDLRFMGLSGRDTVEVDFESATRRCTVNYAGAGYTVIAETAREMVERNGLHRLTGGNEGQATVDVYEGPTPRATTVSRFIIVQNAASNTAAISYSERVAR